MDLREAYVKGYIDACEMNANFGFDENCNNEMVEAVERWLKEDASQPNIQADADKDGAEFDFNHANSCTCFVCRKRKRTA